MEQVGKYDWEMAQYILNILRTQPMVMCSWGFRSPLVIKNGLRFHVNGFRHRGWCEVVYNEGSDLFSFCTYGIKGKIKHVVEEVFFDNLVNVIDAAVETGRMSDEEYKSKVTKWLKKGVA